MSDNKYAEYWAVFTRELESKGLIKKKAASEKGCPLYDISGHTGDDTINEAHPEGGTTVAESSHPEGGKVETQIEQHEKIEEAATNIPTGNIVANAVLSLSKMATSFEDAGHEEAMKVVDEAAEKIADLFEINVELQEISEQPAEQLPTE